MWLNKELYLFTMVISMPKENASKTTNVGLFYVNVIINFIRYSDILLHIVIKSFINLFTMLMNMKMLKTRLLIYLFRMYSEMYMQ